MNQSNSIIDRLVEIKQITADIVILTGLHVGCGSDTMEIGGMDNPIVKDPYTNEPYIPGSSIKGKIRSQIEWRKGKFNKDGGACDCGEPECFVCRVFGVSADVKRRTGPTRLIVRDARVSTKFLEKMRERKFFQGVDDVIQTDCDFSPDNLAIRRALSNYLIEVKSENSLNRITASAVPRPLERVSAGAVFGLEMSYRVFSVKGDDGAADNKYLEELRVGILALEQDALGGYGSRGCGRVKIENLQLDGQPWNGQ